MSNHYKQLETEINELLAAMNTLTPSEIAEVRQFLSAGEYGLAFETLCGISKEEKKPVPVELRRIVHNLAIQMDIDPIWWNEIVNPD